ncbi:MAG: hypothetical protein QF842_07370 [Candidatus Marinimicrobia bacterium]|nr:hypothetical protein [Candidatus Neomarinimicrobiota bacterium]
MGRRDTTEPVVVVPVVRIVPVAIGNPTVVIVVVPAAAAKNASGFEIIPLLSTYLTFFQFRLILLMHTHIV